MEENVLFDRGFIEGISELICWVSRMQVVFVEVLYPNIANAIIYKNNLQKSKIFRTFAGEIGMHVACSKSTNG